MKANITEAIKMFDTLCHLITKTLTFIMYRCRRVWHFLGLPMMISLHIIDHKMHGLYLHVQSIWSALSWSWYYVDHVMMIFMVTTDCNCSSVLTGRANVNNCSVSVTITTSVIEMFPEGNICMLQRSHWTFEL